MSQPKVHLLKSATRSPCRYTSNPLMRPRLLQAEEFAKAPAERKCAECEAIYQRLHGAAPAVADTSNFAAGLSSFLGMS